MAVEAKSLERLGKLHAMQFSTAKVIESATRAMYNGAITVDALNDVVQELARNVRTIADMLDLFIKVEIDNETARISAAVTDGGGDGSGPRREGDAHSVS